MNKFYEILNLSWLPVLAQYFENQSRHMARIPNVILSFLLCSLVLSQSIVDFTYSQYANAGSYKASKDSRIVITSNRQLIQGYDFPAVCSSLRMLTQPSLSDSQDLLSLDLDTLVDGLKEDFVELLRISQKINKKKGNIQELEEISNTRGNITSAIIPNKDMELLRQYESRLRDIDNEVAVRTQALDLLVTNSMKNQDNNQFMIAQMDYEIEALQLKVSYFQNLQKAATEASKIKVSNSFGSYFEELQKKFDEENKLMDDLKNILKNYNQIGQLKDKIGMLKGVIDINEKILADKELCDKQKQNIENFQKNQNEIKQMMVSLREKKRDGPEQDLKFCRGVTVRLEEQIKESLRLYDLSFLGAEDLQELRDQLKKDKIKLNEAEKRLKELEGTAGIDDYKKKVGGNRLFFQRKKSDINVFSLAKYHHSPIELGALVIKAQKDLKDAQNRRSNIDNQATNKDTDYRKIKELVQAIKKLKGNYCHQYDRYDKLAQSMWNKISSYEAESHYQKKIGGLYESELDSVRDLEAMFRHLRDKILQKLK